MVMLGVKQINSLQQIAAQFCFNEGEKLFKSVFLVIQDS